MTDQCIVTANNWLLENSRLGSRQRNAMAALCPQLVDDLSRHGPGHGPLTVGISGAPGSGKSTLARMITAVLNDGGKRCQLMSLDDYYLTRQERLVLAGQLHPLCAVRGVPGTHDLPLLLDHINLFQSGDITTLALPRFDKSSDDRVPALKTCDIKAPLDYLFVEGWLLGATRIKQSTLQTPINQLEAEHDPRGVWRRWWYQCLLRYQAAFEKHVDLFWYLRVPGWDAVIDWRWQQEQELPLPALVTRNEVEDFLGHFQRLAEHMQASCNTWADLIIQLDESHCATMSGES